jgi:putative membrane-bound dehydrogenase-like protein
MKIISIILLFLFPYLFINDGTTLYVPEGFEVELWAESPMLYNPTNMDVDARGRIWVTEAVEYRDFNNKPADRFNFKDKGDRVVILEDTDHDGKADKSTVFVQDMDLKAPLGIAVIGNKIFVSASPHVIVYTDENQDDKPDKKEVFLTGFGGFDHDHSLHSFLATPYGKFIFNTGNAGPHLVQDKSGWTLRSGSLYAGGTPYIKGNAGNQKSDDGRVWVGGLALEIAPDASQLKVMAHNFRNSYEVAMDSYGNMWQNDNDDQVIACRTSWLMEGSNAGYFSKDGTRYWQGDRRLDQDIFTAHWHQEDPGVLKVGDKTGAGSPTGVTVYEGDAFGQKYRGMLLSCEAGRNLIFGYKTSPKGAGFNLKRFDLLSSFPISEEYYVWNDNFEADKRKWFRPSDAVTGTDGAIYVADWYDAVVGGHAMNDKKGYGRIYRIRPKGKKLTSPTLDFSNTKGLVDVLKSPAINVRAEAYEKLKSAGEKIIPEIEPLLSNPNPYIQARAIWLLAALGTKGVEKVTNILMAQVNPFNRVKTKPKNHSKKTVSSSEIAVTAYRALRKSDKNLKKINHTLLKYPLPSALLREIVIGLRDLNYEDSKESLMHIATKFNAKDPYLLTALGIGVDEKRDLFYPDLIKKLPLNPLTYSAAQSAILWELHPNASIHLIKKRAQSPSLTASQRKEAMTTIAFMSSAEAAHAMLDLTKSKLADVAQQADYWLNFRKTNAWENVIAWQLEEEQQLSQEQKWMIQSENSLLNDTTLAAEKKQELAQKLAIDIYGARLLLADAAKGKIKTKVRELIELHIFNNKDLSIRSMAADYFKRSGGKSLSLDLAMNMPTDIKKGKDIFETNCLSCHKIAGKGADIGPDLTLIKKKFDKKSMLDAIINPSASLAFGYEPWMISTSTGSYYGFLMADAKQIILKDLTGKKNNIKASDVTSRVQQKNSLMPEPSSMGLKEKDLSDLTGYLLSL